MQIKVELQESMGSDRSIAEAAWTSSIKHQNKKVKTDEEVKNVITFLANHNHASPFESVIFRFWIKMPISIDRQYMTHRIQSSNGMSGRYRTMPAEFLEIPEDTQLIANLVNPHFINSYNEICQQANEDYEYFVEEAKEKKELGVITNDQYKRFREFARGMLPQHNMTERVSIMNLRSFANFQKLRNSDHAQPEIRLVAQLMLEEIKKHSKCPIALELLEKKNWQI